MLDAAGCGVQELQREGLRRVRCERVSVLEEAESGEEVLQVGEGGEIGGDERVGERGDWREQFHKMHE